MDITVKLFASFRKDRFVEDVRTYQNQATVKTVLVDLGIRQEDVGIVLVNTKQAQAARKLKPGDEVSVFPIIGGG